MINSHPNILHLRATNFYGGPERQLHQHALTMLDSDFKITISSFTEKGEPPELLKLCEVDQICTHLFEVSNAYDFSAIEKIRTYLNKNKIDILCTHDYRSSILGHRATRKISTCWLPFSRGWTSENLKVKMYHALDKIVLRLAKNVIAVSSGQKEKLIKLGVNPATIIVAHNAVLPDQFEAVAAVNLREKFNLPPNAVICVSGGRFSDEKGQLQFIKAVKSAIKVNQNLRFILFGDGPNYQPALELVKALQLEQYILCPGFEPDMISCLKGADILINPSLSEGLPNIVLEAMATRVPVIATNVGGLPELITDQHSGRLTNSGDHEAMVEAIIDLGSDKQKRDSFADYAYQTIVESFSFKQQANILTSAYQRVLKERDELRD